MNAFGPFVSTVTATQLIAFADLADDWHWHVIACSPGPRGDVTVLIAEHPDRLQLYPPPAPDANAAKAARPSRYRIVHLIDGTADGRVRTVNLAPGIECFVRALTVGDGLWLLVHRPPPDHLVPTARVVDEAGRIVGAFRVGWPSAMQATEDGRLWLGVGDEQVFGGRGVEHSGIVCLDSSGRPVFQFRDEVTAPGAVPHVWACDHVNVASNQETCAAYLGFEPKGEVDWFRGAALVRLDGYRVGDLWPWPVLADKAPVWWTDAFAVAGDRVLLRGQGDHFASPRPIPDNGLDHLYLVPLSSQRSQDLVPVDAEGNWIGPFRTEGRASRLYLTTARALFMVDAATLPHWTVGD